MFEGFGANVASSIPAALATWFCIVPPFSPNKGNGFVRESNSPSIVCGSTGLLSPKDEMSIISH